MQEVPKDPGTADLVRSAQAGSREAFAALVARERDRLVMAARAILRDRDEAEDCAQDALVRAWMALPSLRDPGSFRGWVARILVRLALGAKKRRLRLLRGDVAALPAREGPEHDRLDALEREVERLPVKFRLPLALHYLAGLSCAETAEVLEIPEKRVKSRLYDARRKLERRLGREREE